MIQELLAGGSAVSTPSARTRVRSRRMVTAAGWWHRDAGLPWVCGQQMQQQVSPGAVLLQQLLGELLVVAGRWLPGGAQMLVSSTGTPRL